MGRDVDHGKIILHRSLRFEHFRCRSNEFPESILLHKDDTFYRIRRVQTPDSGSQTQTLIPPKWQILVLN